MRPGLSEVLTKRWTAIFLWLIVFAGILDRLILVSGFHFKITDVDQLILWHGAIDYAKGVFREPFFYGQNYGPMSEALLSVPLINFGIGPQYALPIVTMLLSMLPFWILGLIFWKMNSSWAALIALLWPICMDVEYGVLINQPRGFVAGIGFASLSFLCMIQPKKNWAILLFSAVAPLSLYTCPNSALLLVCTGTYLWLHNYTKWRFYVYPNLCFLLTILIFKHNQQFYDIHPEVLTHFGWNAFNWDWLFAAFRDHDLNRFFRHLFPLIGDAKAFTLLFVALISVFLFRGNKKLSLSLVAVFVISILALGHSRIHNGMDNDLFYPIARNWYSLPAIMAAGTSWLSIGRKLRIWHFLIVSPFILILPWQKSFGVDQQFEKYSYDLEYRAVPYRGIEHLESQCDHIRKTCTDYEVDLIVFVHGHSPNTKSPQLYNYGCSLLINDFPNLMLESKGRFTWNQVEYGNMSYKKVLIYGFSPESKVSESLSYMFIPDQPNMILVEDFPGSTFQLLNHFGLNSDPERRARLVQMATANQDQ